MELALLCGHMRAVIVVAETGKMQNSGFAWPQQTRDHL